MRLRSTIPAVTATALLAAALAVPAQAMADTAPSPTPTDTSSAPASPAPTSTAPAAVPAVDDVTAVDTDHGVVLQVTAHGAADISTVEVTATPVYRTGGTTFTSFTLTSGQSTNGVWETTAPLGLTHGQYTLSADVVDSQGNRSTAVTPSQVLTYDTLPVYHDIAFGSTQLSYGNEQVTATGRVTQYDPASGDNGKPFVNSGAYAFLSGYMANGSTPFTNPTGSFKVTASPGPNFTDKSYTLLGIDQYAGHTTLGTTSASAAAPAPTRIVLDSTSGGGYVVGAQVKLSGVAQYEDAQQVWHPLTGYTVEFGQDSYSSTVATTDADGRFSLQAAAPYGPTTWNVYLAQDNRSDAFLAPASASYQVTSVIQPVTLGISGGSIDEFSDLNFWYSATSATGQIPGNKIYVLESANGSTGWKNLGYIQLNGQTNGYQSITAWVDNPHGYWKLWYPGASGYTSAYSGVIHTFRYLTSITGGKPNTTTTYKGRTLHFSGGLWEQGMGNWFRMGANWRVYLYFRPYGSKTWKLVSYTRSDRNGYWNLYGKATTGGTWEVAWFTSDSHHVDAFGPATYVHVR